MKTAAVLIFQFLSVVSVKKQWRLVVCHDIGFSFLNLSTFTELSGISLLKESWFWDSGSMCTARQTAEGENCLKKLSFEFFETTLEILCFRD